MNAQPKAPSKPRPASIIIRPRDLMALLSVSRHGLARMVEEEGLKPPIQLGRRSVGYLKHEVDEWLEGRMAQRDRADA